MKLNLSKQSHVAEESSIKMKINLSKQRQVAEENSFSLGLRLQKFLWFYHPILFDQQCN